MEWKVVDRIFSTAENLQILKVTAPGNLKFSIWVKSNLEVPLCCMLTPVIDGYIANHDKGHFVAIQKVVPFSINQWEHLKSAQQPTQSVNEDEVVI
ncbi:MULTISPECIES: hypothetical protein [Rahnella]|jgi:signal transduction protein PmrD|uniref:hypothetical protein n=1 Tax=Rahnella TaxID=34037 RepID=UPI001C271910|nr:hypothetical protein [Rahnella rivi]MBU9830485.1 hypothetical protein [Rahnella rivi]